MAIYHFSVKIISRGKGQNAVASAAYRSGEKLVDEQSGEVKYYARTVAPECEIIAPVDAPDWVYNREKLWNEVEKNETRINSQLARELEIALPIELNNEQQKALLKEFIKDNCVDKGMVADICIHRDKVENPHAHVMLTMRHITEEGFTNKDRSWNGKPYIESLRKEWAIYANRHLEKVNAVDRLDHRSYEEQDVSKLPTRHLGHEHNEILKKGGETELTKYNHDVKKYNDNIISLEAKREELLDKGIEENKNSTVDKESKIVVALKDYNFNQSNMRRAFVARDKLPNQIKKLERELSKFDNKTPFFVEDMKGYYSKLEQLESKKEELHTAKINVPKYMEMKRDYTEHAKRFLQKNSPLLAEFATSFKQEIEVGKDKDGNPKIVTVDKTGEMLVRFSNAVEKYNNTDFVFISKVVEKDLHFDKVKRIVGKRVTYDTINSKLDEFKEIDRSKLSLDENKGLTIKESSLIYAKEFYETQAISELRRNGYSDLVSKYADDNRTLIKLYENMQTLEKISPMELDNYTHNTFKLENAERLIRGRVTFTGSEFKLRSLNKWVGSLEREKESILENDNLSKEQIDRISEIEKDMIHAKGNIQIIQEGQNIALARSKDILKNNPDMKKAMSQFDAMNEKDKVESLMGAYAHKDSNQEVQESFVKDQLNRGYEYKVTNLAYRYVGYNNLKDYATIKERIAELDKTGSHQAYKAAEIKLQELHAFKANVENLHLERKELSAKRFKGFEVKSRINTINQIFEKNGVTAKSLSGAMKQINYLQSQNTFIVNDYKMNKEVKLPILKEMKVFKEYQALSFAEKQFEVKGLVSERKSLLPEDIEKLVAVHEEFKKNGSIASIEKLDDIGIKAAQKVTSIEGELRTLKLLREEYAEKQAAITSNIQSNDEKAKLISFDIDKGTTSIEDVSNSWKDRKEQSEEYKEKIKTISEEEKEMYDQLAIHRKQAKAFKGLGRLLTSMGNTANQSKAEKERRRRLKAIKQERGNEEDREQSL